MTIEEIEAACDLGLTLDFSRHRAGPLELPLNGMFYPLGFPMKLRTNSAEVLDMAHELFGSFEKHHDTEPIRVDMRVTESDLTECPPLPLHRFIWPVRLTFADVDNFMVYEMERGTTHISVTSGAMRHKPSIASLFLSAAAGAHLTVRYITPVHAACVALNGHGVLLNGDSGAGKSTLSYSCARAGWTFVTDDGSYLVNGQTDRMVIGDCSKIRFRPMAAELFHELKGHGISQRLMGKPSIELPTATLPGLTCAQTARVDFVVFLNRRSGDQHELLPYRKDVARYAMRRALIGPPKSLARGYETIERLLTMDILELRYTDLDWAVERLRRLVQEGQ
jgi:hypothetical protein